MTSYSCRFTFVIFFLLYLLKIGNATQCYSCAGTKACQDPVNITGINTVHCNERNYGCMKQASKTDQGLVVDRGCTVIDFCVAVKDKTKFCNVCTDNLCNSSSLIIPSTTALLLSIIFYLV